MHDGDGPLRGHNGALKRRAGVSLLTRGSQQAPLPRAIPPPELQPQIHDHASAGNVTEHRRPTGSTNTCRKASWTSTWQRTIRALRPCVCRRNHTHNNTTRRRVRDGNVTVNASVSMIQPNTSRRVSPSVILLVNKRGGSDTPRSPNKQKWSDANDCTALKQRRPSGHHLSLIHI